MRPSCEQSCREEAGPWPEAGEPAPGRSEGPDQRGQGLVGAAEASEAMAQAVATAMAQAVATATAAAATSTAIATTSFRMLIVEDGRNDEAKCNDEGSKEARGGVKSTSK